MFVESNGVGNPFLSVSIRGNHLPKPGTHNSFPGAIDVSDFTDLDEYRADIDELAETMNGLPIVNGAESVLVPGQSEEKVHAERVLEGIPLPSGTEVKLIALADRLGLELPVRHTGNRFRPAYRKASTFHRQVRTWYGCWFFARYQA